ncbi:UNVERIFIED_CONTAM: hypothetical protein GTU68_031467 [Idotea baltica]|nr:hypothetical protein [Idotea baltica]
MLDEWLSDEQMLNIAKENNLAETAFCKAEGAGTQADIEAIMPDQALLNTINLDPGGIIVTAPGNEVDFVSRFFTPQASIFEDPVTGSAHCSLIPFWAKRLKKDKLLAQQLSDRGGTLYCENVGDRVWISGEAVTFLKGTIYL